MSKKSIMLEIEVASDGSISLDALSVKGLIDLFVALMQQHSDLSTVATAPTAPTEPTAPSATIVSTVPVASSASTASTTPTAAHVLTAPTLSNLSRPAKSVPTKTHLKNLDRMDKGEGLLYCQGLSTSELIGIFDRVPNYQVFHDSRRALEPRLDEITPDQAMVVVGAYEKNPQVFEPARSPLVGPWFPRRIMEIAGPLLDPQRKKNLEKHLKIVGR